MSLGKHYLVVNGYKQVNKPDAIIICNTFMQSRFMVTIETWAEIIGSIPPYVRNDTAINDNEFGRLFDAKIEGSYQR